MAGFEVIVRPVVRPNIRPPQARTLAPEDDPERSVCVLNGSSGQLIDLPISVNVSFSRSKAKETKRRFDEVRIKKMDDAGNVDDETFVDVEVLNRIEFRGGDGTTWTRRYADAQPSANVEIRRRNVTRTNE